MIRSIYLLGVVVGVALAAPLAAQSAEAPVAATSGDANYSAFTPRPSGKATRIDYGFLDEALEYMVLRMGPSTREGQMRPDPMVGTRLVYGHESRFRLEGNRILFSFLEPEAIEPLGEYLRDLERLGSELDIAALPRDEQLAYWMNLHNVAVIEALARNYPVRKPSEMKLDGIDASLDTAKLVTVGGVALSPRDIRTRIVFPNWDNADVVYGFFRGEVGGPSIQRRAFTGENVAQVLDGSAKEFVNSLRGVEAYGKNLLVSRIYEEAAPFYYPAMASDLRAHLSRHASVEVAGLLADKPGLKVNEYDDTIADLAAGDREPIYQQIESDGMPVSSRITPSIARLLNERRSKMEQLRRDGELRGRVIVLPPTISERAKEAEAAAGSGETEEPSPQD